MTVEELIEELQRLPGAVMSAHVVGLLGVDYHSGMVWLEMEDDDDDDEF